VIMTPELAGTAGLILLAISFVVAALLPYED
jgi:hypothetical protein